MYPKIINPLVTCMKQCINLFHFKNGKIPILLKNIYPNFCITTKIVFFGYSLNIDISHFKFIINLLLFLAKFYIHKCKFSKKTLSFLFLGKTLCM